MYHVMYGDGNGYISADFHVSFLNLSTTIKTDAEAINFVSAKRLEPLFRWLLFSSQKYVVLLIKIVLLSSCRGFLLLLDNRFTSCKIFCLSLLSCFFKLFKC